MSLRDDIKHYLLLTTDSMRLGFDVRALLDDHPSGVGSYTAALLDACAKVSDVTLVPVTTGRKFPKISDAYAQNVVRYRVPNRVVNLLLAFFSTPQLDRFSDVDSYILTDINFLSLRPSTRLTLVVHDLSFERNPSWYTKKQRLRHRMVQPKKLAERADKIIAVSEWTKRDLQLLYKIPEEKIQVIYPTPSIFCHSDADVVPQPSGQRCDIGDSHRLNDNVSSLQLPDQYILFIGTIEKRKNALSLVVAFDHLAEKYPNHHLILAGKPGFGASEVFEAIRVSKYSARIHYLGYVSEDMRQRLYEHAALFAYPSFYEGFGIPLLDAMCAGLPIVTGQSSAMPEVIDDAGLLVDPYDIQQIIAAIDAILSNTDFARELSLRARARSLQFPLTLTAAIDKKDFFW